MTYVLHFTCNGHWRWLQAVLRVCAHRHYFIPIELRRGDPWAKEIRGKMTSGIFLSRLYPRIHNYRLRDSTL